VKLADQAVAAAEEVVVAEVEATAVPSIQKPRPHNRPPICISFVTSTIFGTRGGASGEQGEWQGPRTSPARPGKRRRSG